MIDLQVNGLKTAYFDCNFWSKPEDQAIDQLCSYQYEQGISGFLATIISSPIESIITNLECIQTYRQDQRNNKAQILGVHLEGGLITKLGVHPDKYSQVFDLESAKYILKKFPSLIRLWTLCPLADTNGDVTRLAQDHGVTISYGHSKATYHEALEAFEKYKVNMVTHWGNAMYVARGFKQRETTQANLEMLDDIDLDKVDPNHIGIGLAAYRCPNIYCTAIAGSKANQDEHLDPRLLRQLALKKQEKFILVSDSVAHTRPVDHLVGGLTSLKQHCQNALAAGIPEDLVNAAVTDNVLRLRLG
jgi:hypothetical protein